MSFSLFQNFIRYEIFHRFDTILRFLCNANGIYKANNFGLRRISFLPHEAGLRHIIESNDHGYLFDIG